MARTISATDARVRFGKLLRDVGEGGETVVVEKSGHAQVVILPLAEYNRLQSLETRDDRWERLLDQAIALVDRDAKGRRLPPADEVIRAMREERHGRALDLP